MHQNHILQLIQQVENDEHLEVTVLARVLEMGNRRLKASDHILHGLCIDAATHPKSFLVGSSKMPILQLPNELDQAAGRKEDRIKPMLTQRQFGNDI